MKTEPYAGMWDFDGSCAPAEDGGKASWQGQETFTLGCFQWTKRAGGKGLKKGRVQWRAKGNVAMPKTAYDAAREFCARKNLPIPTPQDSEETKP